MRSPALLCTSGSPHLLQKKQALRITLSDDDLISASVEGVATVLLDGAGAWCGRGACVVCACIAHSPLGCPTALTSVSLPNLCLARRIH